MDNVEMIAALDYMEQKYGTHPTKLVMNRHTRDELSALVDCSGKEIHSWADIPVEINDELEDHDVEFVMPEGPFSTIPTEQLEELVNESSLPVGTVQSQG